MGLDFLKLIGILFWLRGPTKSIFDMILFKLLGFKCHFVLMKFNEEEFGSLKT